MTIYYRFILIMGVLALFSCKREEAKPWKKMDFQLFTLSAPSDWDTIKMRGVDSYIGGLTNGDDTLIFDYGAYCGGIHDSQFAQYRMKKDTINGIVAGIAIPITNGNGVVRLRIPHFKNTDNQFEMSGRDIVNTSTILKIFKSIRFAGSDTTLNSNLRLRDFKEYPALKEKAVFDSRCGLCHRKHYRSIINRDSTWLSNLFTNQKALVNDPVFTQIKTLYGHYELDNETAQELIFYIRYADGDYF